MIDVESATVVGRHDIHDAEIVSVVASLGAYSAWSVSRTGDVNVTDLRSGNSATVFSFDGDLLDASFSSDGKKVAFAAVSGEATILQTREGTKVKEFHIPNYDVTRLAFTSNKSTIVCATSVGGLWHLDIDTGRSVPYRRSGPEIGRIIAFSNSNRVLVAEANTVRLWDTLTRRELIKWPIGGRFGDMGVSPEGTLLIASGDPGYGRTVFRIRHVTSVSQQLDNHGDSTVRVWDIRTGEGEVLLTGSQIMHVASHPSDDLAVAVDTEGPSHMIELEDPPVVRELDDTDEYSCVAFSPSGKQFVLGGKKLDLRIYDSHSRNVVHRIPWTSEMKWLYTVAWPVDDRLFIGNLVGAVFEVEISTGTILTERNVGERYVIRLKACRERPLLTSITHSGHCVVWDHASGETMFQASPQTTMEEVADAMLLESFDAVVSVGRSPRITFSPLFESTAPDDD